MEVESGARTKPSVFYTTSVGTAGFCKFDNNGQVMVDNLMFYYLT